MSGRVEKITGTNVGLYDDIAETIDPVFPRGKIQLLGLKVIFDETATNSLTVTLQSGSDYTWSETVISGAGVTSMSWTPTKLFLSDDEQILLAWTNPNTEDPDPESGWTWRLVFKKG